MNGKIVGDSMEQAIVRSVGFKVEPSGEIVAGKKQQANQSNTIKSIRIVRRFNFSSALKRMSCIVRVTLKDGKHKFLIVAEGRAGDHAKAIGAKERPRRDGLRIAV